MTDKADLVPAPIQEPGSTERRTPASASIPADELLHHQTGDPHKTSFGLSDVILGGQDGLVNVLGVILGVAAATAETRIVLAAGLAATFAESVSMGAVAYTSKRAEQSFYESERQREHRHILQAPSVERDEIRRIYAARGFQRSASGACRRHDHLRPGDLGGGDDG